MKIAILTDAIYPFTIGGSEIRNHEIAKRLVKKGHEVHVYGGKFWEGKDEINIDGVKINGAMKYELHGNKKRRSPIKALFLSLKLSYIIAKEKYDIIDVCTFNYFHCFTGKIICKIKKTNLVFTWHQYLGDYLIGYFGKIKGEIAKILEKISTKLSNNNIAVSKKVKVDLIKKGVNEKEIKVIYNGVDLKRVESIKVRKKYYDLIYVGRLNYQKNLSLLVKTINIVKKEIPKIKVCIIGGGPEEESIKKLIEKLNLKNNFYFYGEIKERDLIFKYLKSSKIFILTSILEGFPLTLIEANASGVPVITTKTRHNNTEEYIENNINGLVVEPFPNKISKEIIRILKNRDLLKKMSENSKIKSKNFGWDKIAEETEAYYEEIMSNKR